EEDVSDAADSSEDAAVPVDIDPNAECQLATDCLGKIALGLCARPVCDAGTCVTSSAPDGVACDDTNPCTLDSICTGGECGGGIEYPCDDADLCTSDTCDPVDGCVHASVAGGCDDGNVCTLADHCVDGVCVGGNSVCSCTTTDDCLVYNDGDLCTGTLTCQGGICKTEPGSAVDCPGGIAGPCEVFGCSPTTGSCDIVPVSDGTSCDDSDPCTIGDTCEAGICTVGTGACICDVDLDCVAYDDGNLCNGIMRCEGGFCVPNPDSVVVCDAPGGPCEAGACEPTTGECNATPLDGQACDDKNPCTTADVCAGVTCAGTEKSCDDNNPCTDDACGSDGQCTNVANVAPCSDSDDCTVGDTCAAGACVPGTDQCSCTTTSDCGAFEDGDPCTGTLECVGNMCVTIPGTPVICDGSDSTDCAASQCNPSTAACELLPINNNLACFDGNPCTDGEVCQEGTCGGGTNTCSCVAVDELLTCNTSTLWSNGAFGSTNKVDAWPCAAGDFSGPEFAWPVFVKEPTAVTVTLNSEEANTWVFVTEDAGAGCDPTQCKKGSPSEITFIAFPGLSQFVVLDGKGGETGKMNVTVSCESAFEAQCNDGFDNDNDGNTDCVDQDCEADPWCAGTENCTNGQDDNNDGKVDCVDPDCAEQPICQSLCTATTTTYCGFSQFWHTGGTSSSNEVNSYACSAVDVSGPEVIYSFDSNTAQTVTVDLPQSFFGHHLAVMAHAPGGCNGAYCQAAGPAPLQFFAAAGTTYYIAVDGQNGAQGDYKLSVSCL
ncbi:MAG: hypothetical protein ACI9OJ_001357, partial [Myxococcota bacterium]